jgi:hypothetical protein
MTANPADIVERLRAWSPLVAQAYEVPAASTAMHEAASLIEAQQAEISELRRIAQARKEHSREMRKEIAVLQKALEFYADVSKYPAPLTGGTRVDPWPVGRKLVSRNTLRRSEPS